MTAPNLQQPNHTQADLDSDHVEFQIAPEGATFSTIHHLYQTRFRDMDCERHKQRPTETQESMFVPRVPTQQQLPVHCFCSTPVPVEILVSIDKNSGKSSSSAQDMEVCSGGCNEPDSEPCSSGINDYYAIHTDIEMLKRERTAVKAILHERVRAYCESLYSGCDRIVVETAGATVEWTKDKPVPAYFSPGQLRIVAHSTEVTRGHLALMQARGGVDCIRMDFRLLKKPRLIQRPELKPKQGPKPQQMRTQQWEQTQRTASPAATASKSNAKANENGNNETHRSRSPKRVSSRNESSSQRGRASGRASEKESSSEGERGCESEKPRRRVKTPTTKLGTLGNVAVALNRFSSKAKGFIRR